MGDASFPRYGCSYLFATWPIGRALLAASGGGWVLSLAVWLWSVARFEEEQPELEQDQKQEPEAEKLETRVL